MKVKEKTPSIKHSIWDLVKIWSYDSQNDCFISQSKKMVGILQIRTKDLLNTSEDQLEYDILKMTKLYKTTKCDLKIVSLNLPCNTTRQRKYLLRVIDRTRNPLCLDKLEKKLNELEYIEKNNTNHEYFLMFFCDDPEEFIKTKLRIIQTVKQGKLDSIFEISLEKRIKILYKMANKNRIA